jgi:diketogulonate reductase-like aldo/keto reductase
VEAGLARSIGLSNYSRAKLQQLLDSPRLKIHPGVLQVCQGARLSGDAISAIIMYAACSQTVLQTEHSVYVFAKIWTAWQLAAASCNPVQ